MPFTRQYACDACSWIIWRDADGHAGVYAISCVLMMPSIFIIVDEEDELSVCRL